MNTKVLVLSAVVTTFAFTSFAAQPLLSPRAAGNQVKIVRSDTPTTPVAVAYVSTPSGLLSPRVQGNQIKVVQGVTSEATLTQVCRNNMIGSPRAVTECSSHANMPGCVTVALMK